MSTEPKYKALYDFRTLDDVRDWLYNYQADTDHEDDIFDAFQAVDKACATIRNRECTPAQSRRYEAIENLRGAE